MTETGTAAHVRMSPAEMRVVREYLGLTGDALADYLGVQGRSVRRWEAAGDAPIPDGVRAAIEELQEVTARTVAETVAELLDEPDPAVLTYRSDWEYRSAHPELTWPASYHRAIIARVAQQIAGLAIDYA